LTHRFLTRRTIQLIPLAMMPNGATMTDMHPVPVVEAAGLLLGTSAGVFVGLPCCGATSVEPEGLALAVGDGLGVACADAAGTIGWGETEGADETCDECDGGEIDETCDECDTCELCPPDPDTWDE
jgi:hypothetical protein